METVLEKMRGDFRRVATARSRSGEWSAEYERRIGLAIKGAVDMQELAMIARWAQWLHVAADCDGPLPAIPVRGLPVQGCLSCGHRVQFGWPGYCVVRQDLPAAAGDSLHRRLPLDLGLSCQKREQGLPVSPAVSSKPAVVTSGTAADNRASMPGVAAAVDMFSAAFGEVSVVWCEEGGKRIGPPEEDGIKLSETHVGRMFPEGCFKRGFRRK